ncbi:hypothetical protein EYF80_058476 [Liparis tanakae]|uniref:G-protein coupled receptors family 1 profile domain-containing protein n=1 Tax=Liparis tanakae TaxID=230148 RepID=A0A4Z2ESW5_9TELE|nr:hypothetical protein EYF80_058476 [Liparis tanakae]
MIGSVEDSVPSVFQAQEERLSRIEQLITGYKELHDQQSSLTEQLRELQLPSEPVRAGCSSRSPYGPAPPAPSGYQPKQPSTLLAGMPRVLSEPRPFSTAPWQPPPFLSDEPRDLSEPRLFTTLPWQPPAFLSRTPRDLSEPRLFSTVPRHPPPVPAAASVPQSPPVPAAASGPQSPPVPAAASVPQSLPVPAAASAVLQPRPIRPAPSPSSCPVTVPDGPSSSCPVTVADGPSSSCPVTVPDGPSSSCPVTVPDGPSSSCPVTVPDGPSSSCPVTVPDGPSSPCPVFAPTGSSPSSSYSVPFPPGVSHRNLVRLQFPVSRRSLPFPVSGSQCPVAISSCSSSQCPATISAGSRPRPLLCPVPQLPSPVLRPAPRTALLLMVARRPTPRTASAMPFVPPPAPLHPPLTKMNISTINQTAITPPWKLPEEIVIAVAYAANLLFGLPINGYVAWLIVSGPQEKIALDFIPLNQIVVESLFGLSGILYFLQSFLSLFLKNIVLFLNLMFVLMRPVMQGYLCLEHYFATVHPVIFLWCKPLRYKVAVCSVSWLTVITLCVLVTALDAGHTFSIFLAALDVFFFMLMTFCGVSVLGALKRPAPGEGPRDRGNNMKNKAFKIILIYLVTTTFSQLPMPVLVICTSIIPAHMFPTLYSINMSLYVTTSFVPSMMYLYRVGKLFSKCNCL